MAVDRRKGKSRRTDASTGGRDGARAVGGDSRGGATVSAAELEPLLEALRAVRTGRFDVRVRTRRGGIVGELARAFNEVAQVREATMKELLRAARVVGREGRLGERAVVPSASGSWGRTLEAFNGLVDDLVRPTAEVARVIEAVAEGDLSQKTDLRTGAGLPVRGEFARIGRTVDRMVDQLSVFAEEVTRVAREVGTEGKLGGQARVKGVSGVWKDLTENVNTLADNLTRQVRNIAEVTTAVANGDLSRKITVGVSGEVLELKETINTMVDQLRSFASEVTRVAREVGSEGRLGGQARVEGVSGTWKDLTDSVNFMAGNLTTQVRGIARVVTAVANGDLDKKFVLEARGEVAELADTINRMVDQLSVFAEEVTRVAREVGTEGKLGGQARVKGVSGVWEDLTDSVNGLADNLSSQVRNVAEVTTAVANGDLSRKITVDARGEVLQLKETINTMVDQLSSFADEVTRVAKEVGTEGRLGGQAKVRGVSGVWKDLTDNVNGLAETLTTQLRSIADVSTAVTQGDLSRSIAVEAWGEVAELKDNINEMIGNLRETTRKNAEQDWLNSNLARFSGMLQGQRDLEAVSRLIMSRLTPLVGARYGGFFAVEPADVDDAELRLIASYGFQEREGVASRYRLGESLVGQAALEGKSIVVAEPPDDYIRIASGLGEAKPAEIVVMPVLFEDEVLAVIELASFQRFGEAQHAFLDQVSETIGVVLSTIAATMRTEALLIQSQRLTESLRSQSEELRTQQEELRRSNQELEAQAQTLKASEELLQQQQEELQQTNEELEEKAQLLEEQNRRIEIKNQEIELARAAIEEKAEQLALSSRYKSEFLANMSHELRTPLNSLLILAKLLSEDAAGNLTEKQRQYARTIHSAGADLLALINDILDLSKVEAGQMDTHFADVRLVDAAEYADRTFRPLAEEKGLELDVMLEEPLPASIHTDGHRLQQILRNLLSNACKFTAEGRVELRIAAGPEPGLVSFTVADTGIGIPREQLPVVFEAFQQADGTTSRTYGGTGLGLSISREIARLLGGSIAAESTPGEGSTFTLVLPAAKPAAQPPVRASGPVEGVWGAAKPPVRDSGPVEGVWGNREVPPPHKEAAVDDDRDSLQPGDRVVLIVEDDVDFAETVLGIARERGFKGLVALSGDAGFALARKLRPDAIVLDLELPVEDGTGLLDHLKHDAETRHIPVHIVSAGSGRQRALRAGAVAFLEKPATREQLEETFSVLASFIDRGVRRLLVVEDDETQRSSIVELIGPGEDVEITAVGSSAEAVAELERRIYDCMVLDLTLPDRSGFVLLEQVKSDRRFRDVPIIVYTGRELTKREETRLRRYAETIIVKDASSPERLLDETSLFLHRVESRLPSEKRRILEQLHGADAVFQGKKVLIADDDVRNVFALTSVLESGGMEVLFAENGREAMELLNANPDVDLVLMDLMMPELDGYEAMRAIRVQPGWERLPVIALTAKAMKGDREKSIQAGASDYVTKPVDTEQLLSLIRVWLYG